MPPTTNFSKPFASTPPSEFVQMPLQGITHDTVHAKSEQVSLLLDEKASLGPLVLKTALSLSATFGQHRSETARGT